MINPVLKWIITTAVLVVGAAIVADNWLQVIGLFMILWAHNMERHVHW